MRCALKCGVAQLSDFSEDVIERESLRSVRIHPIIADLVCSSAAQFVFPTMQEDIDPVLYELGSIFQLDPELTEELDELEFIRSGIDDCARAREAARRDSIKMSWILITMWLQFQFKCQLQKKSVNLKLLSNVDEIITRKHNWIS